MPLETRFNLSSEKVCRTESDFQPRLGQYLRVDTERGSEPVSYDVPKVLMSLKDNYVVLNRELLDFERADIREVYLLTGYRGNL